MLKSKEKLDLKYKKVVASGVHHKTGKHGYTGTIIFTSTLLRDKEKRDYTKPGKVVATNMYT